MNIRQVLQRRTDLSTFLVHLTRDEGAEKAKDKLLSILTSGCIEARAVMGHAQKTLQQRRLNSESQKCVCFTETPLEYVNLLVEEIEGRTCQFKPYGIAFTKKIGRRKGANPVWYVDITPGHEWLSNSINRLIDAALDKGDFEESDIGCLTPFIEQMGSSVQPSYRKEFWWEREWRYVGDFMIPWNLIGLCPESEIPWFEQELKSMGSALDIRFIDPLWSLEQIIAHLAGFKAEDVDIP
jgi:hypothetical protein